MNVTFNSLVENEKFINLMYSAIPIIGSLNLIAFGVSIVVSLIIKKSFTVFVLSYTLVLIVLNLALPWHFYFNSFQTFAIFLISLFTAFSIIKRVVLK